MRVVLDTKVLISVLPFAGISPELFQSCKGRRLRSPAKFLHENSHLGGP